MLYYSLEQPSEHIIRIEVELKYLLVCGKIFKDSF